jgi:hypothetical protein
MKQADNSTHRGPVATYFALKGTREWCDWLDRFSESTRLPKPVLIDQALGQFALERRFELPPLRVRGQGRRGE